MDVCGIISCSEDAENQVRLLTFEGLARALRCSNSNARELDTREPSHMFGHNSAPRPSLDTPLFVQTYSFEPSRPS